MKLAWRVAVFALGAALLFYGWHRSHRASSNIQNSGAATTGDPAEVLVVIGAFLGLLAFAPSPETLGRWMSLKRKHHAPPAQFRRRRRSG